MIGGDMPGLVVLRSLTKTWGLAGLRAGYAVGDADVIARLAASSRRGRSPTPALAGDGRLPVARSQRDDRRGGSGDCEQPSGPP